MATKKIGNKWHPIGKRGPWKHGFGSEAAAKKALTKMNKFSKERKSGSKSKAKKPAKKRASTTTKPQKVIKTTTKKKRSWVGWARLGVYVLGASQRAISLVGKYGFTKEAADNIAKSYTGRDGSGNFSQKEAMRTYAPLAAVAAVDTIASKAGVYRRMSSL